MVGMVSHGIAEGFLAAELRKSPDMLGRFAAVVRRDRAKKLQKDYRADTDAMLQRARGAKGYIDRRARSVSFEGPTKDARSSERIGDYAEAARVYGGVYEGIAANIGHVYEGSGRYVRQMDSCIRGMVRCAAAARGAGGRRDVLSRLVRMWKGLEGHDYQLRMAALKAIADPGDADHMLGLLGGAAEGGGGGGGGGAAGRAAAWFRQNLREARARLAKEAEAKAKAGGRRRPMARRGGGSAPASRPPPRRRPGGGRRRTG